METYSILMSVYAKENPVFFETAIQSMLDQTVKPDEFVIVCDGPLTRELDAVLQKYTLEYPELFNIVRLPENRGIGYAANAGLQVCRNDLVVKMDSDDISVPDRCRLQLQRFADNPNLVIVGGYIDEFMQAPEEPFSVRAVPETNEEIHRFARRRQPFNNQTVMYRRENAIKVGGYKDLRRNEDYDFYVRLLKDGSYAENIPVTLVKVRVNPAALRRRASWKTLTGCIRSRWCAYRIGFSSFWDFLYCVAGQVLIFVCPGKIQNMIYSKLLRQTCPEKREEKDLIN